MRNADTMVEQAMTLLRDVTPAERLEQIENAIETSWGVSPDAYRGSVWLTAGADAKPVVEIDLSMGHVDDLETGEIYE